MPRLALVAAVVALPALADARPIAAGVSVGRTQSKADTGGDANDTLGLFARLGLTERVSGQLELQRIDTGDTQTDIRTGTGLLVVDLGSGAHLIPTMFAGIGIDRASYGYGGDTSGSHIEGGFGLEYRADGGFTIGADVRLGGRSIDQSNMILPLNGATLYYAPVGLQSGEYRSAQISASIRF